MDSVSLAPRPGFCVKSRVLSPSAAIPAPRKVFVNIAWDANVPQQHQDGDVPVVVSNPRADTDKAGNPSVVFDCVFHTSAKSRSLRDPEFKHFLVELSLQRIEAQTGIALSRSISTPNIASKGTLLPRTVHIPASILPAPSKPDQGGFPPTKTPLIQELSSESVDTLPALLKASAATPGSRPVNNTDEPLFWNWSAVTSSDSKSGCIKFQVHIAHLTVPMIASSTLHISPRTLELIIPDRPPLIIDLSLSDAEIASRTAASYSSMPPDADVHKWKQRQQEQTTVVLQLKRQRDFDVHRA